MSLHCKLEGVAFLQDEKERPEIAAEWRWRVDDRECRMEYLRCLKEAMRMRGKMVTCKIEQKKFDKAYRKMWIDSGTTETMPGIALYDVLMDFKPRSIDLSFSLYLVLSISIFLALSLSLSLSLSLPPLSSLSLSLLLSRRVWRLPTD